MKPYLEVTNSETAGDQAPCDSPPLPSVSQIESLLRFIPAFGNATSAHAEWQIKPGVVPWCSLSDAALELYRALYEEGFVILFPWPDWQREGMRYVDAPDLVASADLRTLCQLITMHVRADRFCEGHFASQLASGQIAAILHRLAIIRDELSH